MDYHNAGDIIRQCPAVEQWNSVACSSVAGLFIFADTETPNLSCGVAPGRLQIGSQSFDYAGTTGIPLTASVVNTVWAHVNDSDAVVISITTSPDPIPEHRYYKLAEVTCDGTGITDIADKRPWGMYPGNAIDGLYTIRDGCVLSSTLPAAYASFQLYLAKLYFDSPTRFYATNFEFGAQMVAAAPPGGRVSVGIYYRVDGGNFNFLAGSNINSINLDSYLVPGAAALIQLPFSAPFFLRSNEHNRIEYFAAIQFDAAAASGLNYAYYGRMVNTMVGIADVPMYPVYLEPVGHGNITTWPSPLAVLPDGNQFAMAVR